MSFRKMEVGHRFRRIKHNLQTRKTTDEELKRLESVIIRNIKVSLFGATWRKDIAATITTGCKEENVDKRKKKVEDSVMGQNMKEMSVELEYYKTSCLHELVNRFGALLYDGVDEKVKLEMSLERRVYEELGQVPDYEKHMNKMKDKLNLASTDLEIAQKDLEKEPSVQHQETCDAMQMKYEAMKDAFVTDIFTSSVTKEVAMNNYLLTTMQLKRDYYQNMSDMYSRAVPEVEAMIANAVRKPVFGVSLEEHLSSQHDNIALVLSRTCDFLRQHGMKEKGIFRVSGNAAKVKRIRAALDAGLFDADEKNYLNEQHAVASTLKAYLRELPDPLTMESMQKDWIAAINCEGEERFNAIDLCLSKMSRGHRDNLIYLMRFLYDLESHKADNAMTASNLAIVFAPTVTGMVFDGTNTFGVKLMEFMITNAARIFHFGSPDNLLERLDTSPPSAFTRAQSSISPRSFRPKEKAPPPPVDHHPGTSDDLIDFQGTDDDDFFDEPASFPTNGGSLQRSSTERRPNRPPPPSFRSTFTDAPKSRPISYNIAVGARPTEAPPKPMTASMEEFIDETPVAPERKRLSMMSVGGLLKVGQNGNQLTSQDSVGSQVTDGGDNRTLVSIDGEPPSPVTVPNNIQPPPQSTKPKPPLPFKPKDLSNESSRL